MTQPLKIVFLGTPEFACPTLQTLLQDQRFKIQAVITQEDKKVGRKQILTPSPVKELALQNEIPVFQPLKISKDLDLITHLRELAPDFLVVVAYGQIVSQKILDLPKIKAINIHGSILPLYRGASPIEQTLLNQDAEAGISIMEMTLKMDQGPVYQIHTITIEPTDNNPSLRQKLSHLGAQTIGNCLMDIADQKISATPQDEQKATYCQKINKEDGLIIPAEQNASTTLAKLKAFNPWPGIFLSQNGKNLKILQATNTGKRSQQPGHFETTNKQIFLHCQDQILEISELQLEGKNPMSASVFLAGNRQILG